MQTTKFLRKPLVVEAVRVDEGNMAQVAEWAGGVLHADVLDTTEWYIDINIIHPLRRKERRAHIGEWVLKSPFGYKIYTDRAFKKGFEPEAVENLVVEVEAAVATCICGHPEIEDAIHSDSFPCYANEPAFDDQGAVYAAPQSLGFQ